MPAVAFTVEPPHRKWVISMQQARISALSLETLRFPVFADAAGTIYNPTADAFAAAFLPPNTDPQAGDWKTGGWDTTAIGTYTGTILVGPGGATALAKGDYFVWARITTATETVIRQVGELAVD